MSEQNTLAGLHEMSGKVREMYGFGDQILMVASDRISAFDVVLPTPIPHKGRVLTGMSLFWFEHFKDVARNHLISARAQELPDPGPERPRPGRPFDAGTAADDAADRMRRARLPGRLGLEGLPGAPAPCAAIALPAGMQEAEKLPKPIFTPATKATDGHDINIDRSAGKILVGDDRFDEIERISIELYEAAADYAATRGIIIADTKFEFGLDDANQVVLGDEVLTPDSSRFWPADSYKPGSSPPVVRQAVRARLAGDARLGQAAARPRGARGRGRPAPRSATSRPTT